MHEEDDGSAIGSNGLNAGVVLALCCVLGPDNEEEDEDGCAVVSLLCRSSVSLVLVSFIIGKGNSAESRLFEVGGITSD